MSARGRKAQLVPPKSAIAVELDQEFHGFLDDDEELASYFDEEPVAHFLEAGDYEGEVIDMFEFQHRSGMPAAFLG